MIAIVLIFIWINQYEHINKEYKEITQEIVRNNQIIELGNTFFFDETEMREGYSIELLSSEIISFEEFEKKYNLKTTINEIIDFNAPDRIYEITIKVYNRNNTEGGIDIHPFILQGIDNYVDINTDLFILVNDIVRGNTKFALKSDSEIELSLPFNLRKELFSRAGWDGLDNYDFYLVLSKYPIKKMIKL